MTKHFFYNIIAQTLAAKVGPIKIVFGLMVFCLFSAEKKQSAIQKIRHESCVVYNFYTHFKWCYVLDKMALETSFLCHHFLICPL